MELGNWQHSRPCQGDPLFLFSAKFEALARAWAILIGPARGKLADGTWAIVGANQTTK